jgi:hypothetical protein
MVGGGGRLKSITFAVYCQEVTGLGWVQFDAGSKAADGGIQAARLLRCVPPHLAVQALACENLPGVRDAITEEFQLSGGKDIVSIGSGDATGGRIEDKRRKRDGG